MLLLQQQIIFIGLVLGRGVLKTCHFSSTSSNLLMPVSSRSVLTAWFFLPLPCFCCKPMQKSQKTIIKFHQR